MLYERSFFVQIFTQKCFEKPGIFFQDFGNMTNTHGIGIVSDFLLKFGKICMIEILQRFPVNECKQSLSRRTYLNINLKRPLFSKILEFFIQ
jgi:hypothetical protein